MKKRDVRMFLSFAIALAAVFQYFMTQPQMTPAVIVLSPTPLPTSVLGESTSLASDSAKVVKVVDGDTIRVSLDGKNQTIRLIGINTPETVDPRKEVECFGKEASAKAKELLQGKTVFLEADDSQGNFDKYQRLLRYVWLNGVNINKELIAEGFAYEYTYDLPYKYQTEFKRAQLEAQTSSKGLWSEITCGGKLK